MTFSNVSAPWRIQDLLTHALQTLEEEDVAVGAAVGRLEDVAVEQLAGAEAVGLAAGDDHSVVLLRSGAIFVMGNNRCGNGSL